MTYRRFSSLGPKTELMGPGYVQFKAKLAELKSSTAKLNEQDDMPVEAASSEVDPDLAAGIWGMNDGGNDGD